MFFFSAFPHSKIGIFIQDWSDFTMSQNFEIPKISNEERMLSYMIHFQQRRSDFREADATLDLQQQAFCRASLQVSCCLIRGCPLLSSSFLSCLVSMFGPVFWLIPRFFLWPLFSKLLIVYFKYVAEIQSVQERMKFEFVETLSSFLYSWLSFYHVGHVIHQDFKPFLAGVQEKVHKVDFNLQSKFLYLFQTKESYHATKLEADKLKVGLLFFIRSG